MKRNYECGKLIKLIDDELEKQANGALASQNLTLTQMRVLMELEAVPRQQMSLKELEALLHVAQSTAAGIALRLEQKGFVVSFCDENDRRVKRISLTPAGLSCCKDASSHVQNMETQLLAGLTREEKELFRTLLEKVYRGL